MKKKILVIAIFSSLFSCGDNDVYTNEKLTKTNSGYVYSKNHNSVLYQYLIDDNEDTVRKIVFDTVSNKTITDEGKMHFLSRIKGGVDKEGNQFVECHITSLNVKGQQKALAVYEELPNTSSEDYPYLGGCPISGYEGSTRITFKDHKPHRKLIFLLVYAYEHKEGEEVKIANKYPLDLELDWEK